MSDVEILEALVGAGFDVKVGGYLTREGMPSWTGHVSAARDRRPMTVYACATLTELLSKLAEDGKSRGPEFQR